MIRVFDYGEEGGVITDAYNLNFHPKGDSRGYQLLAGVWEYRIGLELEEALALPQRAPRNRGVNSTPSCLFNQMIHPLLDLPLTGAIWYQGESNAGRAKEYATLFPEMITDWRAHWGQGDFPFIFVQLAAFQRKGTEKSWPELREAQRRALSLPNTGMAVTIDIGHPTNIHPENKWDVGKRLALNALVMHYNKAITPQGPVLEKAESRDSSLELSFSAVGEGLEIRSKYGYILGFEISEDGETFLPARGELRGKDRIILWTEGLDAPRYVRYAWENYPVDASLFNSAGLPASPFRTGTWKWYTAGNRYGE
jgi:sialate O-acetylesterase